MIYKNKLSVLNSSQTCYVTVTMTYILQCLQFNTKTGYKQATFSRSEKMRHPENKVKELEASKCPSKEKETTESTNLEK